MTRLQAEQILHQNFNLSGFYDEQWDTIEKILDGERVLMIQKTGFGKSLCFQFPALLFEGMTIVFTPLISLMRDQVKKLQELGISANCIYYEQENDLKDQIIEDAKQGNLKILYISPERQENSLWIDATNEMNISMIVVDEAHCITVWGHDFRPAFKKIINLVNHLPSGLPVLATTATATKRVEKDVIKQIGNCISIRGDLMRENFRLYVIKVNSEDEKMVWIGKNLEKLPGSGIIYSGTRVDTEIYNNWCDFVNIPSTLYNAGLDADSRIEIEQGLMENRWKTVISTNALGMGIDKPDIRFIIHTQIPQSPIHYYQEIGRAGRDNKPSNIILFYNPEDKKLPLSFIENARPTIKKHENVIKCIKNDLFGEKEIMTRTNIKQNQFRIIKNDLVEQGIIREVLVGRNKKYEFIPGSSPFNTQVFDELKELRLQELENMITYVETNQSRMKYLCEYLGDDTHMNFKNCDNTGLNKLTISINDEWKEKLNQFRENYFPELKVETSKSNMINGVAASYYGITHVGQAIHRSKYENGGDFPDFLLRLVLKAFRKKFAQEEFDLILYVPPTSSGDLVKNFATKVSQVLKIPVSHDLIKERNTEEQKVFENGYLKTKNVTGAFGYKTPDDILGKNILLIDDIFDSGATVKEIGKYLTSLGAQKIAPLVIARTVAGDLV